MWTEGTWESVDAREQGGGEGGLRTPFFFMTIEPAPLSVVPGVEISVCDMRTCGVSYEAQ